MSHYNDMKFSAKDEDNDNWTTGNCALESGGAAFWHGDCEEDRILEHELAMPTGKYREGVYAFDGTYGIEWPSWKGITLNYSLKEIRFLLIPAPEEEQGV